MYIISQKKEKILQICRIFKVELSSQGSGSEKSTLSGNGYKIFKDGLILQWGTSAYSQLTYVSFPIPFPHAVFSISWTAVNGYHNPYKSSGYVNNVTRYGFTAVTDDISVNKYWIAIGY